MKNKILQVSCLLILSSCLGNSYLNGVSDSSNLENNVIENENCQDLRVLNIGSNERIEVVSSFEGDYSPEDNFNDIGFSNEPLIGATPEHKKIKFFLYKTGNQDYIYSISNVYRDRSAIRFTASWDMIIRGNNNLDFIIASDEANEVVDGTSYKQELVLENSDIADQINYYNWSSVARYNSDGYAVGPLNDSYKVNFENFDIDDNYDEVLFVNGNGNEITIDIDRFGKFSLESQSLCN